MNTSTLIRSAALALVLVGLMTATSPAQNPYFGYSNQDFIYGGDFGVGGSLFRSGAVPVPPYFSLFPPVYYGERYHRPYGLSPIACAACPHVPDSYRGHIDEYSKPMVTRNPYCVAPEPLPAEPSEPETTATAQHVIVNPFVKPAEKLALRSE